MNKMIGYCGLNCRECEAYKATINNDEKMKEKVAKEWAKLNNAPITSDMINCLGCKGDGPKTPFCESICEIRRCAVSKEYDSCGQCNRKDTCEKLKPIINSQPKVLDNLK
ncbi:MAG: DUF3795 domain-containing protein [Thomasclavelia sp.]|jgi:hypothetical protein|nr:DUF3795 domain-containing protein [Thomasclavelia sp.]